MKDSDNSLPVQRGNFFRRHVKGLIAAALIVFIMLAYGIPVLVGDGTEKFAGTKRKMAEESLRYLSDVPDSIQKFTNILSGTHNYIDDVVELSPEQARQNCRLTASDRATGYYDVYVSRVGMFGSKSERQQQTPLATYYISEKIKKPIDTHFVLQCEIV